MCDAEFVAVRLNGVQVYSCDASPNRTIDHFHNFLQRLEDSIRAIPPSTAVLVTGDFNARSAAWGDWVNNQRGDDLSALLDSLGLVIANEGSIPTFNRGAGSIVDITAMSEQLACRVNNWTVMDSVFNYSDHHYIRFTIDAASARYLPKEAVGWNASNGIDEDYFHCGLLVAEWLEEWREALDADTEAERIEARITSACNPKTTGPHTGETPCSLVDHRDIPAAVNLREG